MPDVKSEILKLDNESICYTCLEIINEQLINIAGSELLFYERYEQLFAQLPIEYRNIIMLEKLHGEISNGGYIQYFYNDRGRYACDAVQALDAVGATELSRIHVRAIAEYEKVKSYFTSAWENDDMEHNGRCFVSLYEEDKLRELDNVIEREFWLYGGNKLIKMGGEYIRTYLIRLNMN